VRLVNEEEEEKKRQEEKEAREQNTIAKNTVKQNKYVICTCVSVWLGCCVLM
jgi:hypothetical protein